MNQSFSLSINFIIAYYNQMKISLTLLFTILVLAKLSLGLRLGASHEIEHDFCWKDSYGRGVGTIPDDCGTKDKLGLLCYTPCPSGYTRVGLDCQQNCPSGFTNEGLFCRRVEYGRGSGYAWWFSDGFSDSGMFRRCEADYGSGNCEKSGAIVYPKCKPGYSPFGCCICRPAVPNCIALGLNGGVDLSCAKKLIIGSPSSAGCPANKQYDGGLCYPACKTKFYGVGPVCWSDAPDGWVGCGMGAAKDTKTCAQIIIGQIAAVGQLAINIATFGSSSAGVEATNAAKSAGKVASLTNKLKELKAAVLANKNIAKVAEEAKKLKKLKDIGQEIKQGYDKAADAADALDNLAALQEGVVTDADIIRVSAQIAALADPTGVAGVIQAYSYPVCSDIFD